jgi:hypothetical protein
LADNVVVTAGSGTTVAADEVVDGTLGTVKVQYVKLMDGTLDGTTKATVSANGVQVQQATAANLNTTATLTTQAFSAVVTLTRTADTNAYTANDVIGSATGSTAALTFANMGPSGKEILITSIALGNRRDRYHNGRDQLSALSLQRDAA